MDGELNIAREGLYSFVDYRFIGSREVSRLWVVGERGELSLGVPAPERGELTLRRRIPAKKLDSIGKIRDWKLVPADARPVGEDGTFPDVSRFREARLIAVGSRTFVKMPNPES